MRNERFQLAIMNDTEPSARDVAAFEKDLEAAQGASDVLQQAGLRQAGDRASSTLARAAKIPVVGVTETTPPGMSFQKWMLSELDATEKALAGPSS